jgi:mannose-6-phosphate isomerase-like protein (cupin superfamily)
MIKMMLKNFPKLLPSVLLAGLLFAADPTFLRRRVPNVQPQSDDLTTNAKSTSYRPAFGIGDRDVANLKGIARYGELTVGPGGASAFVNYPAEEQIYYILEGSGTLIYGNEKVPVKSNDFMYLPPHVKHGLANSSNGPLRLLVMGYKIPAGTNIALPAKLMLSSADDVQFQKLEAHHGETVQFKLLMGTTESKRDRLAAANVMVSLFIMDFAPGGTNIPHHHDREEEIYYILRGHGDMVAGGGSDGNEGRYPAKAGDAFFIRLNTTVGFYSKAKEGEPHDLILAVRSKYPFTAVHP